MREFETLNLDRKISVKVQVACPQIHEIITMKVLFLFTFLKKCVSEFKWVKNSCIFNAGPS